jgi:hypothetical protein
MRAAASRAERRLTRWRSMGMALRASAEATEVTRLGKK